MSILQEYEEIEKIIGVGRVRATDKYIKHCSENGKEILYSDIVYKEKEYELSCLYKNEEKMIELIKFIKEKLGYAFDCDVKI